MGAVRSGRGIFITGECGTGKTHMGVGLLLDWYSRHAKSIVINSSIFMPVVELFFDLKRAFDKPGGEADIIDLHSYSPMLMLDDLGAEKVSEWSIQVFYLILDRRYRGMLPVIITSNLSLGRISEVFDDRVASRIAEMCEVIRLEGPDRRVR